MLEMLKQAVARMTKLIPQELTVRRIEEKEQEWNVRAQRMYMFDGGMNMHCFPNSLRMGNAYVRTTRM